MTPFGEPVPEKLELASIRCSTLDLEVQASMSLRQVGYRRSFGKGERMPKNPYAAPEADAGVIGIRSGTLQDLYKVATAQKGILIGILIYFGSLFAIQFVRPPLSNVLVVAWLLAAFATFIFMIILALRVYNLVAGIILGLLMIVPFANLLILLMVNRKATQIMRSNGFKVGFMGADLEEIRAAMER
jgi:hypothetical protein